MAQRLAATLQDLEALPSDQKAELVDGALRLMSPTGFLPGRAGGAIYASLLAYERRTGDGYALPDNVGFAVDLPNRQSFSPDAAYHVGPVSGMKLVQGAPVFAAEVRSEHDYGPDAEAAIVAKRRDYFAAGVLVVWDVDLLSEDVVCVYRANCPDTPTIYRRGEQAEAEPAVPNWTMPVDELFS